ncbi:hypothetical protein Hanom_Chr00s115667g01809491 [Helianthus anomalus]
MCIYRWHQPFNDSHHLDHHSSHNPHNSSRNLHLAGRSKAPRRVTKSLPETEFTSVPNLHWFGTPLPVGDVEAFPERTDAAGKHITVSEKTTGVTTELANHCVSDNHYVRSLGFLNLSLVRYYKKSQRNQCELNDQENKNQARMDIRNPLSIFDYC